MKTILFFGLILSIVLCKEARVGVTTGTVETSRARSQGDIIGEAYNSQDRQDLVAITYAVASDGGNNLSDLTGYKGPQLVEKLPDVIKPPSPGPLESVEEVASSTNYYDGSLNLNVAQVDCHVISVPNQCYKQTVCGWCGKSSSCIKGTAMAPIEPCQTGYEFSGSSSSTGRNIQNIAHLANIRAH